MGASVGTPVQRGVGYVAASAARFWTAGTTLVVAGAGTTACNGTYQSITAENGKPAWEKMGGTNEKIYWHADSYWALLDDNPDLAYASTDDVPVPTAGTFIVSDGSAPVPTITATAELVPLASTVTEKELANGEGTEGYDGAIDCYGTGNHRLVISGDYKVRSGSSIPNKGDVIYTSDLGTAAAWVVMGDPEVKGYSSATGQPLLIGLELLRFADLD